MEHVVEWTTLPALGVAPEPPLPGVPFSVPARHNPRLQAVVECINADDELRQWWRCANVNAAERLGLGDHGEVHVRIVANAALKLLRLLRDAGGVPGIVAQHRLSADEAEVAVVLAAALHDMWLSIHPDPRAAFSLDLAHRKARELLAKQYAVRERTILIAETLHAIAALHVDARCLTLEAGVLKVANALDISEGRSRLPIEAAGSHTAAIGEVRIQRGEQRPVRIEIRAGGSNGLAQVGEWLRRTLESASLAALIEVVARVRGEPRLVSLA
jgi:hypothetical protein